MANTTYYNLIKRTYDDAADIADINSNMDIIDGQMKTNANGVSANNTSIENIEGGIAYRLGNTNTTGATLAVGTYVYVSGNSTLADGLYKVSTAIAANATLSSSNCTAVSGGGLNALNSNKIDSSKFRYGRNSVTTGIATSISPYSYYGTKDITFSPAFPQGAQIMVLTNAEELSAFWISSASIANNTGFTLYLSGNANNTTKTVDWLAIQIN
jgi:hypothetical protein